MIETSTRAAVRWRVRWWIALVACTGCDLVFSLDRPLPGQFCLQPENEQATLCADFDDEDGSDPFAKFETPDDSSRYSVDKEAARADSDRVNMTIGPHDPEPFDGAVDLQILYDDIVVTTTPR